MKPGARPPERIRFRRDEIVDLDGLPSANSAQAATIAPARPVAKPVHRVKRVAGMALTAAVLLFFLMAGAVYLLGVTGIGKERLQAAAEHAIERMAGRDIETTIGETRIALDGTRLIGIVIEDVGMRAAGRGEDFLRADSLRFGVQLAPLLAGRLVLAGASVSGVHVTPSAMGPVAGDWLAPLRGGDGLLAPQKLPPVVFSALRRLLPVMASRFPGTIEVTDVRVALPAGQAVRDVVIENAEAEAGDPALLSLRAEGNVDGRPWSILGSARSDAATGRIDNLSLHFRMPAGNAAPDGGFSILGSLGSLDVDLTGGEGDAASPSRLMVEAQLNGSRVNLGPRGAFGGDIALTALARDGSPDIEFPSLRLASGKSLLALKGSIGPRPPSAEKVPAYRYDFSGEDLILAAADSPEPPFMFAGKASGFYDPVARRLAADSIEVGGEKGKAKAQAALHFDRGVTPGVDLALSVEKMPVAQVKQLWPWLAGRPARMWVEQHLRGGTVERGSLDYHVAPGRIGDGIPHGPDELKGSFAVSDTQFDTVGDLPPLDAHSGTITFAGVDADIAVASARAVLPGGRALDGRNGRFALRGFNRAPVIGRLDIDVAGDAEAAAEFASLKPLDALRRLPFAADDLSGTVSGHISADIPLQRGVPREKLDWDADLKFDDLAIARPFQGQTVTAASGSLKVDPQKAVISADARLNGAPASLDFVEPLTGDGPERRRIVKLTLDDKAQDAFAPGLADLLSGPVGVSVDAGGEATNFIADLSKARLNLSWVGWSKGSGIPGKAKFTLSRSGDATTISDLDISGPTFSVTGSASLAQGILQRARLDNVQLNRGDDITLDLKRDGKRLNVVVRGRAFDGRALVQAATAAAGSGSRKEAVGNVVLQAEVASVTGFNGEALKDVSLSYRSGSQRPVVELSARTDSGAAVSMSDGPKGGKRRLNLESSDAGSVLRFLNIYPNMQGGVIKIALSGGGGPNLKGKFSARNFAVVDEPRLSSLVSAKASGSEQSLRDAVKTDINTSRVRFDRASADIEKGDGTLSIADGILRGVEIGSTFQGTLYDKGGRMDMTGTFMPAYGLNRLFSELPLIGVLLGNGKDRGLIGVTFKLQGPAKSPTVTVNPLSIIAPGIFRRIFEFDSTRDAPGGKTTKAMPAHQMR